MKIYVIEKLGRLNIKSFLLIVYIMLVSCTHYKQKTFFNDKIDSGQCEEALENIPNSKREKVISAAKEIWGRTASVVVTSLGFLSDAALVSGTAVAGVAICYPLLELAKEENSVEIGDFLVYCTLIGPTSLLALGSKNKNVRKLYRSGKRILKGTAGWRCPRLNPISRSLRKVASCYYKKGEIDKAKELLGRLLKDRHYQKCLSKKEKENVRNAIKGLKE